MTVVCVNSECTQHLVPKDPAGFDVAEIRCGACGWQVELVEAPLPTDEGQGMP